MVQRKNLHCQIVVSFSAYFPEKKKRFLSSFFFFLNFCLILILREIKHLRKIKQDRFWAMSLIPFILKIFLIFYIFKSVYFTVFFFCFFVFSNECTTDLHFLVEKKNRPYCKRKGIDRICSVKPRCSCVAWLTGPRWRFVNMHWSVGNNTIKVQNSFPYNNAPTKSFLCIFSRVQNCKIEHIANIRIVATTASCFPSLIPFNALLGTKGD